MGIDVKTIVSGMKRAGSSFDIVLKGLLVDPYVLISYSENLDTILYIYFGCHLNSTEDIYQKSLPYEIDLHSNFRTRTNNILKDSEKVTKYFQKVSQDFLYSSNESPGLLLTPQEIDGIYRPLILEIHNQLLQEKNLNKK
jgi:hypothetical protein